MYIQTQETPNPNTIKFIPGVEVLKKGSYHFNKCDDNYSHSPLVMQLFEISGVKSVFLGKDFISVTKEEEVVSAMHSGNDNVELAENANRN